MRTDIAGVIIALVLAFAGMLSVCAQDAKVSEVRKVDAFSSVEITSVGTIHFTQSDTYSFRIEGRERYVKNTQTTVKDGRLLIGFKDLGLVGDCEVCLALCNCLCSLSSRAIGNDLDLVTVSH